MTDGINNLKNEVTNLQVEDYVVASKSLTRLYSAKDPYNKEMPIRVLDSLIENEEKGNNGFSVYNRGQNLKKSLIDPKRVKEFVKLEERKQARERLMGGGPAVRNKREKAQERL